MILLQFKTGQEMHLGVKTQRGVLDVTAALSDRYGEKKPWREMVNGTFALDEANAALRAVEERTAIKAVITPNPDLVGTLPV